MARFTFPRGGARVSSLGFVALMLVLFLALVHAQEDTDSSVDTAAVATTAPTSNVQRRTIPPAFARSTTPVKSSVAPTAAAATAVTSVAAKTTPKATPKPRRRTVSSSSASSGSDRSASRQSSSRSSDTVDSSDDQSDSTEPTKSKPLSAKQRKQIQSNLASAKRIEKWISEAALEASSLSAKDKRLPRLQKRIRRYRKQLRRLAKKLKALGFTYVPPTEAPAAASSSAKSVPTVLPAASQSVSAGSATPSAAVVTTAAPTSAAPVTVAPATASAAPTVEATSAVPTQVAVQSPTVTVAPPKSVSQPTAAVKKVTQTPVAGSAPVTAAPSAAATAAPTEAAVVTPAPTSAAPVTAAPVTAAPVTAASTTAATAAPTTAPTSAPTSAPPTASPSAAATEAPTVVPVSSEAPSSSAAPSKAKESSSSASFDDSDPCDASVSSSTSSLCGARGQCQPVASGPPFNQPFSCVCDKGFEPSGTQGACADIDECEKNTHDCPLHSRCINTLGSFRCECDEGFKRSSDQRTCVVLPPLSVGRVSASVNQAANSVLVEWSPLPKNAHPIEYSVEWSIDAKFPSELLNTVLVKAKQCPATSDALALTCSFTIPRLALPFSAVASYYVRVRARNPAGMGPAKEVTRALQVASRAKDKPVAYRLTFKIRESAAKTAGWDKRAVSSKLDAKILSELSTMLTSTSSRWRFVGVDLKLGAAQLDVVRETKGKAASVSAEELAERTRIAMFAHARALAAGGSAARTSLAEYPSLAVMERVALVQPLLRCPGAGERFAVSCKGSAAGAVTSEPTAAATAAATVAPESESATPTKAAIRPAVTAAPSAKSTVAPTVAADGKTVSPNAEIRVKPTDARVVVREATTADAFFSSPLAWLSLSVIIFGSVYAYYQYRLHQMSEGEASGPVNFVCVVDTCAVGVKYACGTCASCVSRAISSVRNRDSNIDVSATGHTRLSTVEMEDVKLRNGDDDDDDREDSSLMAKAPKPTASKPVVVKSGRSSPPKAASPVVADSFDDDAFSDFGDEEDTEAPVLVVAKPAPKPPKAKAEAPKPAATVTRPAAVSSSPASDVPDSEAVALVRKSLVKIGVPEYGVRKYAQSLNDANLRTVEELQTLTSTDWRRLELPSVIEDAIRDELTALSAPASASVAAPAKGRGMQLVKKQPAKPVAKAAPKKPVVQEVSEDGGWGDMEIDEPQVASAKVTAVKKSAEKEAPKEAAKEQPKAKKASFGAVAADDGGWGDDDMMDLKF